MEGLEAEDPDLVEQIRRLMFVFEDILLVNDKGIQSVLKEVDNEELSLAPQDGQRGAQAQDLQEHVRARRAAHRRRHAVHGPGARQRRRERAQQKIVDVVRRLEDAGEIIIAGRGGEKEMVV